MKKERRFLSVKCASVTWGEGKRKEEKIIQSKQKKRGGRGGTLIEREKLPTPAFVFLLSAHTRGPVRSLGLGVCVYVCMCVRDLSFLREQHVGE
jgi:hypothetical protein